MMSLLTFHVTNEAVHELPAYNQLLEQPCYRHDATMQPGTNTPVSHDAIATMTSLPTRNLSSQIMCSELKCNHCQRLWQVEWDGCISNKLHCIKPTIGYVNVSHLSR